MPERERRYELGTAPWNRVLSTHRAELLLEHLDERLTDRRFASRSAPVVAPKDTGQLLHNLLHAPGLWRLTHGIIRNFSIWRDEVRANQQRESVRILANSADEPDQKTVARGPRCLRKCRFYVYLAPAVRWPRG
jgi:hypothetical protein